MDWNKAACLARQRGDLPGALGFLLRALDEERATPDQLALTYSNISAILSKIGRHSLALRYAHSAVLHCKHALGTGVQECGIRQRTIVDLSKLAVACHNLAVQMEFRRGPACLRWYAKATSFAAKAAHLASRDASSDLPSVPTEPMELGDGIELRSDLETVASVAQRISLSHVAASRKWAKKGYEIRQESSETEAAQTAAGAKDGTANQWGSGAPMDVRYFEFDLGNQDLDSDLQVSNVSPGKALSKIILRPDDGSHSAKENSGEPANKIQRNASEEEEVQNHLREAPAVPCEPLRRALPSLPLTKPRVKTWDVRRPYLLAKRPRSSKSRPRRHQHRRQCENDAPDPASAGGQVSTQNRPLPDDLRRRRSWHPEVDARRNIEAMASPVARNAPQLNQSTEAMRDSAPNPVYASRTGCDPASSRRQHLQQPTKRLLLEADILFGMYENIKSQALAKLAAESPDAIEWAPQRDLETSTLQNSNADEDIISPAEMLREIEEAEQLVREKTRTEPEFRKLDCAGRVA